MEDEEEFFLKKLLRKISRHFLTTIFRISDKEHAEKKILLHVPRTNRNNVTQNT